MVDSRVKQEEIYWINLPEPKKSEPGFRRPCVVIQSDSFNRSRIKTTVICILTTNLKLAKAPGNVVLDQGEAGLSRSSVINVSQILTVNKDDLLLQEKIGKLNDALLDQVIEGVKLVVTRY